MEQLLLHLWGDFIIQSDWMAQNKKKKGWLGRLACQLHCITYTVPFLLLTQSPVALFYIYFTHYIIDRNNIVLWFMNTAWKGKFGLPPFGPWSHIVIDNILHISCNYIILKFL